MTFYNSDSYFRGRIKITWEEFFVPCLSLSIDKILFWSSDRSFREAMSPTPHLTITSVGSFCYYWKLNPLVCWQEIKGWNSFVSFLWGNTLWIVMKDTSSLPPLLNFCFVLHVPCTWCEWDASPQAGADGLMRASRWGPLELKTLTGFSYFWGEPRGNKFCVPVVAGYLRVGM